MSKTSLGLIQYMKRKGVKPTGSRVKDMALCEEFKLFKKWKGKE